jgi:hypothetical protein
MLSYFRITPSIDRAVRGVALLLLLMVAEQAYRGLPVNGYGISIACVALFLCFDWFKASAYAAARLARSLLRAIA